MVEPASSRVQKNADQAAHRGVLSQKKLTILLDFFLVLLPTVTLINQSILL
jgi:hypothetical protein